MVFQLFYKMVLGRSFTAGAILKFLTQVSLGAYVSLPFWISCWWKKVLRCLYDFFPWFSVAVGLAFGLTSVLWLGFIFNDTVIEIALTLAVSYLAYFTVRFDIGRNGPFQCFYSTHFILYCLVLYLIDYHYIRILTHV